MVLCEACCPVGIEVDLKEVHAEVEMPCFCELCNQLIAADEVVRTPTRSAVRGAFVLEGRPWRKLVRERLTQMASQPGIWAQTRGEFMGIVMTWFEALVYAGEITAVPMPDYLHILNRRGNPVSMENPPDAEWARKVVERAMYLLPIVEDQEPPAP
jgi:hypothetical protein